ncbi:hypothetical protein GCM10020219_091920 [Nonomuraea dietziae]
MTAKQFASVWTREPRQGKAQGLTRDQIVRAAIEILDAEGLDALSMRKLGARLGAGATSLYWHVANKDELFELVYDEVWGEMSVPDPDSAGWRDTGWAFAHGMRKVILRHPWLAGLLGKLPAIGPNALRAAELLRKGLHQAGFRGLEEDYAGGGDHRFRLRLGHPRGGVDERGRGEELRRREHARGRQDSRGRLSRPHRPRGGVRRPRTRGGPRDELRLRTRLRARWP